MLECSYGKYQYGDDGYYAGAVLKPGEEGIILDVVRRPGGEWVSYRGEDGSKYAFPIWTWFPDESNKTSLSELTRKEFVETMRRLNFLAREAKNELYQCYRVLKAVYAAAEVNL